MTSFRCRSFPFRLPSSRANIDRIVSSSDFLAFFKYAQANGTKVAATWALLTVISRVHFHYTQRSSRASVVPYQLNLTLFHNMEPSVFIHSLPTSCLSVLFHQQGVTLLLCCEQWQTLWVRWRRPRPPRPRRRSPPSSCSSPTFSFASAGWWSSQTLCSAESKNQMFSNVGVEPFIVVSRRSDQFHILVLRPKCRANMRNDLFSSY